jgi:two-component system chemotaxis response regulator CheB
MKPPVRVLVVDDSALMRKLIPQILAQDDSIEVVGTAMDGNFALRKIPDLRPHVITLDLEMPGLGGMEVIQQITRRHKLPIIVVSSHTTKGAAITFKALAMGAFDFVAKPADISNNLPSIAQELIGKIKAAAQSKVRPVVSDFRRVDKPAALTRKQASRVIAIGVSTGGPHALQYMLSQLPADFPGAIVIVQHMPEGFTEMFARRLDECCTIGVKEAQSGDLLLAGRALVCPANRHLKVKRLPLGDVVVLSDDPRENGHRPSVDVLFRSLAEEFGPRGVAILMTGMGEDGAAGMGLVKQAGGLTVAQNEESCVVYGMPRAAVERGFAQRIVSLDAMANTLLAHCEKERGEPDSGSYRAAAGPGGTK